MLSTSLPPSRLLWLAALPWVLAACTGAPSAPPTQSDGSASASALQTRPAARAPELLAVTASMELIRFQADQPRQILQRQRIQGLPKGDTLLGIDFRVARGVLYALSQQGQLYTLHPQQATLQAVGAGGLALPTGSFGLDFNPTVDRLRVAGPNSLNLRLHPDTGALVDGDAQQPGAQTDGRLHYAPGDTYAGRQPDISAVAYTYNPQNDQLTTNYAIDKTLGTLAVQGSLEAVQPQISPNTGQLHTVGPLGLGPLADASLDISDVSNQALAAVRGLSPSAPTRLYQIDLATGRARVLGVIGDGEALLGIAIVP